MLDGGSREEGYMKVIVKLGSTEMVIQSPNMYTRPTITGPLWEAFKDSPLEHWLTLYKGHQIHKYIEIDFALALKNDPQLVVEFVEPIDGYESTYTDIV